MEVEVSVHEELYSFEEVDVIVPSVLDQFVVLDADVDVGEGLLVAVVQVAQLHPLVHQAQRDLVLFLLILNYLLVVVDPPGLVHVLSATLPEGLDYVDDHEDDEAEVEAPYESEAKPAKAVPLVPPC